MDDFLGNYLLTMGDETEAEKEIRFPGFVEQNVTGETDSDSHQHMGSSAPMVEEDRNRSHYATSLHALDKSKKLRLSFTAAHRILREAERMGIPGEEFLSQFEQYLGDESVADRATHFPGYEAALA